MVYLPLAERDVFSVHAPTIVSVEITNYEHVGIDQPDHDVVDSSVYLAEMYAVIRCMDHVLD